MARDMELFKGLGDRRRDVFGDLFQMNRTLSNLLDDWFTGWPVDTGTSNRSQMRGLLCDVDVKDDHYMLSFEVPGIPKDNIQIEVVGDQLVLSGERHRKGGDGREMEKFSQTLTLPSDADGDKLEASYRDGVLQIAIPKSEAYKPRKIQIGDGASGFFSKLASKAKSALGAVDEGRKSDTSTERREKAA
jgi:HSP20 family protein